MPTSDFIRRINPYTEPVKDPKSQTLCGGILALTLLPLVSIGYTAWFVNDFIINSRGTSFSVTQVPVNKSVGVRLDADYDGVMGGEGQRLICTARSGCWYSVIADSNGNPDTTCPPS